MDEGLVYLVIAVMVIAAIIAAIVMLLYVGLLVLAAIAVAGAIAGFFVAIKNFFEVLAEAHTAVPGSPGTSKRLHQAFATVFAIVLALIGVGVVQALIRTPAPQAARMSGFATTLGVAPAGVAVRPALTATPSRWLGTFTQAGRETKFEAVLRIEGVVLAGTVQEPTAVGAVTQANVNGTLNGSYVSFQKRYSNGQTVSYSGTFLGDGRVVEGTWTAGSIQGAWMMKLEAEESPAVEAKIPNDGSPMSYEAEEAVLSGAARLCRDHRGFMGRGFVCGYGGEGAGNSTITTRLNAGEAGQYEVSVRYANGMSDPMTLSIYVNDAKIRQTVLPPSGTWDAWSDKQETLELVAGANVISFRFDPGDTGNVNLDQFHFRRVQAEAPVGEWRQPALEQPAQRPGPSTPAARARAGVSSPTGRPTTVPPPLASPEPAPSVTLPSPPTIARPVDAKELFLANRYEEAINAARSVLATKPDPALELVAAYSYLQLNRAGEALPLLEHALDAGEIAQFPIRHHHRNIRVSLLSGGLLRMSRQGIHFRSSGVYSSDSFSVLWADIKNSEVSRFEKNDPEIVALKLEVRLEPNKRDKTRTFNFFPAAAGVVDGDVVCSACAQYVSALNALVSRYRRAGAVGQLAAGRPKSEVEGTYSGQAADSSGPGKMTWTLAQAGDAVSGTVSALDQRGTTAFRGELRGTLSQGIITFTIQIPQGGISGIPACSISMSGTASVDDQVISGVYSGVSTCTKPLKDGKFSLLKE